MCDRPLSQVSYRLGIWATHPVQYYAPWFRYLAKRMDIEVFYAYRQDAQGQAEAGFGKQFEWDTPLLDGYPYRWLKNVSRLPRSNSFFRFDNPEIYEIVRKENFDAFLVFGWHRKGALQAIRACWRWGVPVLMRGDSHLGTKRSRLVTSMKYLPFRWFLTRLDAHLYVGEKNKAYLIHYGVPEDRLFFAPHFVDNSFFSNRAEEAQVSGRCQELRRAFGIPEDAFVFLFAGKMIPKKRPEDFIRACFQIFDTPQGAGVHALLVGDGPLKHRLENLSHPFQQRIHFSGFRNQTELPALYKACDVLVLPSDGRESWGLVVNEAFACGLPAIVSDAVGSAPDLIEEGATGHTYPVGDVAGLTDRMLALKQVSERQRGMIEAAVARKAQGYSMEKATQGLESALEKVASEAKSFLAL